MRKIFRYAAGLLSNYYAGTAVLFLLWVTFFDGNDLITLFSNKIELFRTEAEISYYQGKIEEVIAEKNRILLSPEAQERYAREKFLMKKEDEDVFVIPQEEKESLLDKYLGF